MAIFSAYPTLTVQFLVNGRPAKELCDPNGEQDRDVRGNCHMVRYVEAESGSNFVVKVDIGRDDDWKGLEGQHNSG